MIINLNDVKIYISSKVKKEYRDDLEKLFFHNARQKYHFRSIEKMVIEYGEPRIIENNGYIEMITNKCLESRSLFISQGPILIGVIIYHRNTPSNIEIIHVALYNEYINNDELQLVDLMKKCIDFINIKEIQTFTIGYLKSRNRKDVYFNIKLGESKNGQGS